MYKIIKIYLLFSAFIFALSNSHAQDLEKTLTDIKNVKEQKPLVVTGSVQANSGFFFSNLDNPYLNSPYSYSLSTRTNFQIYGLNFPLYLSVRDHSFDYGTSLKRLKFNPRYKWAKLHLGDTYMRFNKYTLGGRNVRGVGLELTPGIFRFKTLYGKMRDLRSFQDTVQNLGAVETITFSRKMAALAVGVGKEKTNFDIYTVKTWDDKNSVSALAPIPPQDNFVAGSSFRLAITERMRFQMNMGASLFTGDTDVPDFSNNTILDNPLTDDVLEVNYTSNLSYAGDARINYRFTGFNVGLGVGYIQPFYRPLSIAYLNTDVLDYKLSFAGRLFKNKLMVSSNIGIQQNNLTDIKLTTSNRFIGSFIASLRPAEGINITGTYSNFQQSFETVIVNLGDRYVYAVSNGILNLSGNYSFGDDDRKYIVALSGGTTNFNLINENDAALSSVNSTLNGNASFTMNFIPLDLQATMGLQYSAFEAEQARTNYGINGRVGKAFFDKRMRLNLGTYFNYNDIEDLRAAWNLRTNLNASYAVNKSQFLSLGFSHIFKKAQFLQNLDDYRGNVGYRLKF